MADDTGVIVGGLPYKASQEQAAQIAQKGGQVVSQEAAQDAAQAQADINYVNENWGAAGTAGLGVASGLTLGLAPGIAAQLGLLPSGAVQAAQSDPLYTGGDVVGTLLPALLTGGESAALRATPAGLMGMAGSASERLALNLMGETPGVLGRLGKTALQHAARGATEGALISLGHTIGDNLVQNKPLAIESLAAAGADGALFGGLIGGTLGAGGAALGAGLEGAGAIGKRLAGGRVGQGIVARSIGMGAEDIGAEGSNLASKLKQMNEVLETGGSKIGDTDALKLAGAKKAGNVYTESRNAVIRELSESAPTAVPDTNRINSRINSEVMAPYVGTPIEADVASRVSKTQERIQNISGTRPEPMAKAAYDYEQSFKPLHKRLPYDKYTANLKADVGPASWEKWIQSRDILAKELQGSVSGVERDIRTETLRIVDDEIRQAMMGVGDGIAEKYSAATMGQRLSEELQGLLGAKDARALANAEPAITARDAAMTGASAVAGSPGMGLTWLVGKGVAKQLQRRMEPALAQMAYDASIGGKAAAAELQVKSQVQSSVRGFFKGAKKTTQAPAKAAQVDRAKPKSDPRKEYDSQAARTEQLLSSNHQDRVRRYAKELETMGYGELATAMLGVNQRAVMYLMYNLPPSQKAKALGTMRQLPSSAVPTLQEYKFLRINKAVSAPLSVLESIEKGNVSRDEIKAMKYVYPELYGEVVTEATRQVQEMKMNGEHLPMQKISQLGIILDSAVDSTLSKEYVGAVQMALNAPPAQEAPPEPSSAAGGIAPQDLMTVTQQIQSV